MRKFLIRKSLIVFISAWVLSAIYVLSTVLAFLKLLEADLANSLTLLYGMLHD
jgi:hypothetical protein